MSNLPEFKPLPDVNNLRSNYMSAFNHGMNIYEALVYLQGYVQITYNSVDDLIADWNNFEKYIDENISQIANEKTQEILNQWKSDGTLNELIAQNPLWNQKVNKSGDVMSGDLQFQENTGVYGTLHSGKKVNMVSHSYTGTDDYTQIGDDNAQAVVHSEKRPVWYDGSKNQDLLVEKDLEDLNVSVSKIQNKIESGAYFTENDEHPTITNYQGNKNVSILQPIDVVDNLSSTETELPLSANQGKQLKTLIDSLLPDLVDEQEIPLPFNLWTGHQAYLKMVHTGQLRAGSAPTIAHRIQNAEVCIIVTSLSFGYSDSPQKVWVNIPRPTRGQAEAGQGVMAHASLQNISITMGTDANFSDSYVTLLFSKTTG